MPCRRRHRAITAINAWAFKWYYKFENSPVMYVFGRDVKSTILIYRSFPASALLSPSFSVHLSPYCAYLWISFTTHFKCDYHIGTETREKSEKPLAGSGIRRHIMCCESKQYVRINVNSNENRMNANENFERK